MNSLTPAMRQYLEIKEQHKDAILLYQMGDFYEMFFEDAVTASRILDITLTSRNKNKDDSIPLCGVPCRAASPYIARLIDSGYKVAVCEQVEDPGSAKGVVKRAVVRIVTPGLVLDAENLPAKENNFLGALVRSDNLFGLAFMDISTGDFRVFEVADWDALLDEILSLNLRELIAHEEFKGGKLAKAIAQNLRGCLVDYLPGRYFASEELQDILNNLGPEESAPEVDFSSHSASAAAAAALIRYVEETQRTDIRHLHIQRHEPDRLVLDDTARKNLELFSTLRDAGKEGSLFHVIDDAVTTMGSRKLRWWLGYPLTDPVRIGERLAAVREIKDDHLCRMNIRKTLKEVADLERLGSRVSMAVANPRDLVALKSSLRAVPPIRELLKEKSSRLLSLISSGLDELPDLTALIEAAILDDPAPGIRDGNMIRQGYDTELDELVSITRDGRKWIAALEEKERRNTGISNLRVGFNNIFGYYIEVTKANCHLVPDSYIRKQTLVNAERYINQELKEYEFTVLNAEEKRKQREYELFLKVRGAAAKEIKKIMKTAGFLAEIDALAALAEIAERYNYTCPRVDGGDVIEIKDGRHPVVERMHLPEGFVPNDVDLDRNGRRMLIITGPNMAGKSTYIRQVALIVLLAQMGSFVPAASAHIGTVDRIFTRVGAADSLSRGESTFMVEMNEVASIPKSATPRSLILLDEVGRGTSTFDGLSIAWAVAEYIHDNPQIGARTLFATHYHQLTDLALTKEGVKNLSVAVKEWGDRIIFLRKIVEGGSSRSYGIQVAGLAGVPPEVIARAREILENLERGEFDEVGMPRIARPRKATQRAIATQPSLFAGEETFILDELRRLDILNTTPLEALGLIHRWKEIIEK